MAGEELNNNVYIPLKLRTGLTGKYPQFATTHKSYVAVHLRKTVKVLKLSYERFI
jgi:hypothetical protein